MTVAQSQLYKRLLVQAYQCLFPTGATVDDALSIYATVRVLSGENPTLSGIGFADMPIPHKRPDLCYKSGKVGFGVSPESV